MPSLVLDALFGPIAGDDLCGEDLEYDAAFAELERTALGRPEQQIGSVLIPAEGPDWRGVQRRCLELLARSKDLRLGLHLTQALLRTAGWNGFWQGVVLLHDFVDKHWSGIYPRLDPDDGNDPATRVNILSGLADPATVAGVRNTVLVSSRTLGRYTLRDLELATGDLPLPTGVTRPTMAMLQGAALDTDLAELQAVAVDVLAVGEALAALETSVAQHVGATAGVNYSGLLLLVGKASKFLAGNVELRTRGPATAASGTNIARAADNAGMGYDELDGNGEDPDGRHQPATFDDVQFTIYKPRTVAAGRWHSLLAFAHLARKRPDDPDDQPDPVDEVREQARVLLGDDADRYQDAVQDSAQPIPMAGEITFLPEFPGIEFNPSSCGFRWLEPVHRQQFRFCPPAKLAGQTVRGKLTVFLGGLIVAEFSLALRIEEQARRSRPVGWSKATMRPFRRIFASYSHKDGQVVELCRHFAAGIGDQYLVDCIDLRAGETWAPRIKELIRDADVFQLFWSHNSMNSIAVRQEWEYALALEKPNFVRPTYWEEPLPQRPGLPPDSLRQLHFQRITLSQVVTMPPRPSDEAAGGEVGPEIDGMSGSPVASHGRYSPRSDTTEAVPDVPLKASGGLNPCDRCGKENQNHYKFCLGCGSTLAKAQSDTTASAATVLETARTALAPSPHPPSSATAGEIQSPEQPVGGGLSGKPSSGIPWNDSPKMPAQFTPEPAVPPRSGAIPGSSPAPMMGTPIVRTPGEPSRMAGDPALPSAAKSGGVACPTCGKAVAPGFAFCGSCGARVDKHAGGARSATGAPRTMHLAAGAAPAAPPRGRLVLIRPDGSEGGVHPLAEGENLIGRGQGVLFDADAYLSPRHGEFTITDATLTVRDLRSLNGVFMKITKEERLEPGDVFRIGQELLRFEVISPSQPLEDGTEIMGTPNPGFWGRLSVVVGWNLDGWAFPLFGDSIVLGRERGDILFPEDGYVSRTHTRISRRGEQAFLSDLGSSSGTFLRIRTERQIPTGAFILMGQQLFRVEYR